MRPAAMAVIYTMMCFHLDTRVQLRETKGEQPIQTGQQIIVTIVGLSSAGALEQMLRGEAANYWQVAI